jgi:exodeoxyribonuclease III
MSWNVNGIRSVLKKGFESFVETHKPDILGLQEIKAHRDQVSFLMPGYHEFWNSAFKKGYSGTAIFSRTEPLSFRFGIDLDKEDLDLLKNSEGGEVTNEGRVVTLEFGGFYFVNVYTPNSKPQLERLSFREKIWDPLFLKYINKLEQKKPVIFCGDMNVAHKEVDLARPEDNKKSVGFTAEERRGFDNIISSGFVDTFRIFNQEGGNYTWWSNFNKSRERNIGWRIDYVCVSEKIKQNLKDAFILPDVVGSDHCPVGAEVF